MEKITNEIADKAKAWFAGAEVREVFDAIEKAADTDAGTFKMVITTENLDRYGEVISMDGWELDHYLKNPVVLWGHDHFTLPVGVTQKLYKEDGKLIAEGRFATHQHAQEVRALYDLGIVCASSVGFLEKERQGNLITKAELIEWSFVNVPANPYALAAEKGISIECINELVMKGFLSIKAAEPEVTEPTPNSEPDVTPEPDEEGETVQVEKRFINKSVVPFVSQLREVADALEALVVEEPERIEDEPSAASEEEKALAKFNRERQIVQAAATIIGDVLAEKRQEAQALLKK